MHNNSARAGPQRSRVRHVTGWVRLFCLAAVITAAGGYARPLRGFVQSKPANWGLWRIDRPILREAQAANQFRYGSDGTGVHIYIIDSGVYRQHHEFTGRTHVAGNFSDHPANPQPTDDVSDCSADGGLPFPWEGHGTHSASYAAGTRSGVAKNAQIWILRASNCQSTDDNDPALIAAVDWIRLNGRHPGVVNISFDVGRSRSIVRDHILAAINPPPPEQGFLYTLSAGSGGDVSARFGELARYAIVAAVTDRDDAPGATDYGDGLTLFAPGIATRSAACCAGGPDAYHVATVGPAHSGAECSRACDSYAAPVVAGVAAAYLQRHPGANPAEVRAAILSGAASIPGLPKPLLQMTRDGAVR
jgi:subtilisin family serine protease